MEDKRENLSGMIAGTLLVAAALINFAEFNIECGFCDYSLLIFSTLAVLASGVLAVSVMKGRAFWLVGIGTLILLLCRLQKPESLNYLYMAECAVILVILILYRLKTYKYEALNLDWSYLAGIVFCGIWIIWQLYFIKGFMNKEMLRGTAVLRLEACQKGFCYLLEEAALTSLLLDVIIHTDNERKQEADMDVSRRLSIRIAVVLWIVAAWNVWMAVFAVPEDIVRWGAWGTSMFELFLLALVTAGLVYMGLALIKNSKKLLLRGILLPVPVLLLFLISYFVVPSAQKNSTGEKEVRLGEEWQQCKAVKPELETGQNPGAAVLLDYEGEDTIIFHGVFGLFVYDIKEDKIVAMLDLESIGCDKVQGAECCDVRVTEDGEEIYLIRMEDNVYVDTYLYQWRENTLVRMDFWEEILEKKFYDYKENRGVLEEGSSIGEICYKIDGQEVRVFDDF